MRKIPVGTVSLLNVVYKSHVSRNDCSKPVTFTPHFNRRWIWRLDSAS